MICTYLVALKRCILAIELMLLKTVQRLHLLLLIMFFFFLHTFCKTVLAGIPFAETFLCKQGDFTRNCEGLFLLYSAGLSVLALCLLRE